MNIETNDPLESPVFASDLVNYAKLDSDDPMIETVLLSATSAVFSFLKQDLMTRTWTLTYRDWPSVGAPYYNQLYRRGYHLKHCIELPYTNLVSVDSVLLGGEASTDYLVNAGKPYVLEFDNFTTSSDDQNAIEITYKAGFGASSVDVPQPIRNAIMMAAGYIYAHNGACDYNDALAMSGAKQLLTPYAVKAGLVI
ncbi:gene transfer agent protein [Alteromonas phage PB15]|nr:gene transfer agent protein [Alteromonas phage PB15]